MIWNLFLYGLLGFFGRNNFNFSLKGIKWLIGIILILQLIDMIRLHYKQKNLVSRTIDKTEREKRLIHLSSTSYKLKLIQVYIFSIIMYGGYTLFIAWIFRFILG